MKRFLASVLAVLASGLGFAGLQADWQAAIDLGIEFSPSKNYVEYAPVVLAPKPGQDNLTTTFRSAGAWNQLTFYVADDFAIKLVDPKGCTIAGLGLVNHLGSGVAMTSSKSAGRCYIERARVQCKGTAWLCEAPNGADFSCMTFIGCDVNLAAKGYEFVGSNNLDPNFYNCTGSYFGTLFDFTRGGCRFVIHGGGGSNGVTGIDCNPGYEGVAEHMDFEVTQTGLRLGSGTGSQVDFSVTDFRDGKYLVQSATNNGILNVSANKCKGAAIVLTGETGYVRVSGRAAALPVAKQSGMKVEKFGAAVSQ